MRKTVFILVVLFITELLLSPVAAKHFRPRVRDCKAILEANRQNPDNCMTIDNKLDGSQCEVKNSDPKKIAKCEPVLCTGLYDGKEVTNIQVGGECRFYDKPKNKCEFFVSLPPNLTSKEEAAAFELDCLRKRGTIKRLECNGYQKENGQIIFRMECRLPPPPEPRCAVYFCQAVMELGGMCKEVDVKPKPTVSECRKQGYKIFPLYSRPIFGDRLFVCLCPLRTTNRRSAGGFGDFIDLITESLLGPEPEERLSEIIPRSTLTQ